MSNKELLLLSVLNLGPEGLPVEGTGELAVVAGHAVACAEGAELEEGLFASGPGFDVLAAGAVAGLAADISELFIPEAPAVARLGSEADGVALDTGGVTLGVTMGQ